MPHACPSPRATGRPRFEVAEIFRAHGPAYRLRHASASEQRKAMWAIEHCRTEVLGGHLDVCLSCGHGEPSYNSCRNRHCPKCQSLRQAAWLEKRRARILPTHYFHVVFTLPVELRGLCRSNPEALYDLLFAAASQTLLDFGRGELSAQLGLTAVLHTWTRDLRLHPHLHCVVTGGGVDVDRNRWVAAHKRYLFPVKALAKRFRQKLLEGLRALRAAGRLRFEGACADLADAKTFERLVDALYRKDWVVYAKRPFGGAPQVFEYLGRYTHRVAISNTRLLHVDECEVRLRTRDDKSATLTPERFIARFLLHVLPRRFVKIRHYGLMAARHATTRLEEARALLEALAEPEGAAASPADAPATSVTEALDWRTRMEQLTGIDLSVCPRCGGVRIREPLSRRASVRPHDTS